MKDPKDVAWLCGRRDNDMLPIANKTHPVDVILAALEIKKFHGADERDEPYWEPGMGRDPLSRESSGSVAARIHFRDHIF